MNQPLRIEQHHLTAALLAWYDGNRRALPWRAKPGERPDPYRVWLSEIMLQQTTVAAVIPYFRDFILRWPTVQDLAAAPLEDVLTRWAGLGYYARARNLHRCATAVMRDHGGRFPGTEEALARLPGIGAYTAGAIAAIAFGRQAAAVDGNAERALARHFGVERPLAEAKPQLREIARALVPQDRPGDFVQALMDLGATVCTARRPRCPACPWQAACLARASGDPERLPMKGRAAVRPVRRGIAFWVLREDGALLLRRRPARGLLGGMAEIPSTEWRSQGWDIAEALAAAPVQAEWRPLPGGVAHVFTHFRLELAVLGSQVPQAAEPAEGYWCALDRLADQPLPSVMRKVIAHGLGAIGREPPR